MFSKHKLDAARIDFHNSFPPTRRSKTCERIEFPSGEYLIYLFFGWFSELRVVQEQMLDPDEQLQETMICDLSWSGFVGHDHFSDLGDLDAFAWSGQVL